MTDPHRGTEPAQSPAPVWLGAAKRVGHAARGIVYASAGALALWRAFGGGAGAGGSREALRMMAGAPLGRGLLAILALGLTAYVVSRVSQAILAPEGVGIRRRALDVASAAIYAALAIFAIRLLLGGAGAEPPAGGSRLVVFLARPQGPWIVGALGAALLLRGVLRLARSHRVQSFGRAGPAARAVILLSVGGSLLYSAAARAPVSGTPWLTGLVAACLLALAALEWTRARYSLPEA